MANSYCVFPYEIMSQIFNLLSKDRNSLYKLLYLSPSYRTDLERMLYRNMTFWLGYPTFVNSLASLVANKRLASYVHRFGIIDKQDWDRLEQEKTFPINSAIWNRVLSAMEGMVNLKALVVDVADSNPPTNKITSLLIRGDQQLHELWWSAGYGNSGSGPAILKFLTSQRELRALRTDLYDCYRDEDDLPVPRNCCPALRHLRSPADIVKKFMRASRPIDNLHVTLEGDEETLPDFSNIKELSLWDRPSRFVNAKFPKVESLKHMWKLILEETDQLSRFPALKEIIAFDVNPQVTKPELAKMFAKCKLLETIFIGPRTIYHDPMDAVDFTCKYDRWVAKRTGSGEEEVIEVMMDGYTVLDCSDEFKAIGIDHSSDKALWKSRADKDVFY